MNDVTVSLPQASLNAHQVDVAFFSVLSIAGAIFIILALLMITFAIRYRRGSHATRRPLPKVLSREIEIGWTAATIFLATFIFWWFVGGMSFPPRSIPGQLEIHVVAKQWMWKTEHPSGASEIDGLHLPVNRSVRLVMTSQDVIHSFYVPAFRLKQDLLPTTVTELEFIPTEIGTYHLLCAEFCGTQHSRMTGEITVMSPSQYEEWSRLQPHGETLIQRGEAAYAKFGCGACHAPESQVHAPKLQALYGKTVTLADGRAVEADESYLRRAILSPRADIVEGYSPIMPSYATTADPSEVEALVAYIKVLSAEESGK